jgi:hypothetical protein
VPIAAENVRNARVTGPANTRTPLTPNSATTDTHHPAQSVVVAALDGNTDKVAVGGIAIDNPVATVAGQNTVLLAPGDSIPFGTCDLADVGIVPRVAGEGVAILWAE